MKDQPFLRMPAPAEIMAFSASMLLLFWFLLPMSSRQNWFVEAWWIWLLFGTTFVLSGLATIWKIGRNEVRDSRKRRGLCPNCGYDLRVSRDRCPECGAVTPEGTI